MRSRCMNETEPGSLAKCLLTYYPNRCAATCRVPSRRHTRCQPMPARREQGRQSADERREAVLEAAVTEFVLGGFYGTSGDAIDLSAGCLQLYRFRIIGTKVVVVIPCVSLVFDP